MIRTGITTDRAEMKKICFSFIALFALSLSANAQQQNIRQSKQLTEQMLLSPATTYTDMVSVSEQSGVAASITLYPNPCTIRIHISAESLVPEKNYTYHLMNLSGQIVASGKVESYSLQTYIPVPEMLSSGSYVVSLQNESLKTIATEKIIIISSQ
jgi:hypothetical protein